MKKIKLNLQMFAEGGGDGAGAATGAEAGSENGTSAGAENSAKKGKGSPLSDVVYGKQTASQDSIADPTPADTASTAKTKSQSFEELIRGEYKDEFNARTQNIINKRFKETKGLQEQLEAMSPIMNMLSEKYGVNANDPAALQKALDDDESFYEQEAMEKGLTVEQLKELKSLQRENEAFKKAEKEAETKRHGDQIYAQWMKEAEDLKAKYGLTNFDFRTEVQNEDFANLLRANVSVESAYKAIHMDDMLGGAMAQTASAVREKMANSIASRNGRPSENATSPSSSQVFKRDVNSLTKADREEISRRVARGAIISF